MFCRRRLPTRSDTEPTRQHARTDHGARLTGRHTDCDSCAVDHWILCSQENRGDGILEYGIKARQAEVVHIDKYWTAFYSSTNATTPTYNIGRHSILSSEPTLLMKYVSFKSILHLSAWQRDLILERALSRIICATQLTPLSDGFSSVLCAT